ncbi:hypothetical protein P7E02_12535 [Enterococcus hulanensis]|uniref:hypothetical protein n=1 Tax=Enterococcus hulanensis TaxID=2559929 RepID=UPI0028926473|nr:hypothetical protein [Enterococcus hulanensis]MDT2660701.1 hypothetical protein [Enterococcus hulanensis]
MNPIVELAKQILPSIFPDAQIYPYRIPQKYQTLEELPIIKTENVTESNGSYGSDRYGSRTYQVQVMAFLDINETDIEAFKDVLDRGLEEKHYSLSYAEDHPHQEFEHIQVIVRQYQVTKLKERGN